MIESEYSIVCRNCGFENHIQQSRCWVCGYHFNNETIDIKPLANQTPIHIQKRPARNGGYLAGLVVGITMLIGAVVVPF